MWISVFSPEKVLYSRENADRMLKNCRNAGIDHVYLQIYRAGKAYYDSDIAPKTEYEKAAAGADSDPLKYLLAQAGKNNIKIYAWINLLSLAQNENAAILDGLGEEVLTQDRHGRSPLRKGNKDGLDKYYIRENQLFLEPGDERVRKYLVSVAEEILKKY
ncbi:MAG: family 10 glycosylhydrolase, partial [Candidatus Omnitrophica bacterium]|nr:family 10 glycosylhydrolase [Candidatus Omnitrophota bacterium]